MKNSVVPIICEYLLRSEVRSAVPALKFTRPNSCEGKLEVDVLCVHTHQHIKDPRVQMKTKRLIL